MDKIEFLEGFQYEVIVSISPRELHEVFRLAMQDIAGVSLEVEKSKKRHRHHFSRYHSVASGILAGSLNPSARLAA